MRNVQFVDEVWKLEDTVTHKGAEPGMKLGFIGLGQGGSKIVDAFQSIRSPRDGEPVYPVIAVNSNIGDLKALRHIPRSAQFALPGYEHGVGKNPDVGREAFQTNGAPIFDEIARRMSSVDMLYVVASLGGGTGTGAVGVLIDAIADYLGIPVGAIVTLPRPDEVESLNAYNALVELSPKLEEIRSGEGGSYRVLENLIVLDNETIVREHLEEPEVLGLSWDRYSNCKLTATLHEWNVLSSQEGELTLDAADLTNQIFCTGTVLTFAKGMIDLDHVQSKADLVHQIASTYKGKNILANGFDYTNDMRTMGVIVTVPSGAADLLNADTMELLRDWYRQVLPRVNVYTGLIQTERNGKQATVYTIAGIAGLPERARNLREEAEQLLILRKEREDTASGFRMGEKLVPATPQPNSQRRSQVRVNPFAQKTDVVPMSKKRVNPFMPKS